MPDRFPLRHPDRDHHRKGQIVTKQSFPTADLIDLTEGDAPDGYEVISDTITGTSRWVVQHEVIFKHGGKYWRTYYSCGATELQDERPFESGGVHVVCEEVRPVETILIRYVPV